MPPGRGRGGGFPRFTMRNLCPKLMFNNGKEAYMWDIKYKKLFYVRSLIIFIKKNNNNNSEIPGGGPTPPLDPRLLSVPTVGYTKFFNANFTLAYSDNAKAPKGFNREVFHLHV